MTKDLFNLNFRDLGGLATNTGKTRSGVLYRGEGPRNFSAMQTAQLKSLGIRAIFDLRSAGERSEMPHVWQNPDCRWLGLDINADLRVFGNEGRERLLLGRDPAIAIDTMKETYRAIPALLVPHWAVIVDSLLANNVPALINCTAGKDRTGVSIALFLELLGVSRAAIMRDYLKSSVFGENMSRAGTIEQGFVGTFGFLPSSGQIQALIGVRSEYLDAAREEVERQWRGIDNYFDDAGVDRTARSALQAMLVE